MDARPPLPTRHRPAAAIAAALAVVLALVLGSLPGGAQGAGTDEERARRERNRSRAAELDQQLDLLKASDEELRVELTRLQVRLDDARRRADEANRATGEATSARDAAAGDVAYAEVLAEATRERLATRAVAAYVQPREESLTAVLASDDAVDFGRRRAMAAVVTERDADVLAEHRAALATLQDRRSALDDATRAAATAAEDAKATLDEIEVLVARQAQVRDALGSRIADVQKEADELAAEDARLTALIRQREAAQTPPTTAAPTTTTAGPGTTRPGGPSTTTTRPTTTTTTPSTPPPGGPPYRSLLWPADGPVTSGFGPRWGRMHRGIDIGASLGAPIRAVNPGTVIFAGEMGGYGNVVLVDHGGYVTVYAHQSRLGTSEGARVSRGQTIGYVGNTGHSTGPHLHFEVRVAGTAVDPRPYLP